MAKDPAAISAKWVAGMQNASQAITDGVNAVTVSPGAAAARNKAGYLAGVQQSADKWARNVQSVTVEDWRSAMITKGAPRIGTGAAAAQGKFQNFMTQLMPAIATIKAGLPARGTLDQNLARANAFARGMAAQNFSK